MDSELKFSAHVAVGASAGVFVVGGASAGVGAATHVVMSSVGTQATCMAPGQAAGCASSLAIANRKALRVVDVEAVHELLNRQGVGLAH